MGANQPNELVRGVLEDADFGFSTSHEITPNEHYHLHQIVMEATRSMVEVQEGCLLKAVIEGYDFMDVYEPLERRPDPSNPREGHSRMHFRQEVRRFNEGDEPHYPPGRAPRRYDLRGLEWDELKANIQGYRP